MSDIKENRRINRPLIVIIMCFLSIVTIVMVLSYMGVRSLHDNVVATRLTDDRLRHGPIEFNGEVYFPSSYNFPDDRNSEVLGEVATKNSQTFSLLLFNDELIADKTDINYTHLKTQGDDCTRFTKAEYLEEPSIVKENLGKYSKFVLCNDDDEKDIRIQIDIDTILELENKFGSIKYNPRDFDNYDKLYYIFVDSPSEYTDSLEGEILEVFDDPIVYLGCIFVVNNQFYYGNMTNRIEGELSNKLTGIIGKRTNEWK